MERFTSTVMGYETPVGTGVAYNKDKLFNLAHQEYPRVYYVKEGTLNFGYLMDNLHEAIGRTLTQTSGNNDIPTVFHVSVIGPSGSGKGRFVKHRLLPYLLATQQEFQKEYGVTLNIRRGHYDRVDRGVQNAIAGAQDLFTRSQDIARVLSGNDDFYYIVSRVAARTGQTNPEAILKIANDLLRIPADPSKPSSSDMLSLVALIQGEVLVTEWQNAKPNTVILDERPGATTFLRGLGRDTLDFEEETTREYGEGTIANLLLSARAAIDEEVRGLVNPEKVIPLPRPVDVRAFDFNIVAGPQIELHAITRDWLNSAKTSQEAQEIKDLVGDISESDQSPGAVQPWRDEGTGSYAVYRRVGNSVVRLVKSIRQELELPSDLAYILDGYYQANDPGNRSKRDNLLAKLDVYIAKNASPPLQNIISEAGEVSYLTGRDVHAVRLEALSRLATGDILRRKSEEAIVIHHCEGYNDPGTLNVQDIEEFRERLKAI